MLNKLWVLILLLSPQLLRSTPDVSLEIHRFRAEATPFIEVSLYIVGASISCHSTVSAEYGVEYLIVIKDALANVVDGNRYRLSNQGCPAKDLIDLRRFILMPGNYSVEVEMTDLHDSLNTISITQAVRVEEENQLTGLSDVQLLSVVRTEPDGKSPLHKSGLYLEPLPFSYYYPALQYLNIYIESYQTDQLQGQPYIQYTISPLAGDLTEPIVAFRKIPARSVSANVFQLDIREMISGPYQLEASLFDGNKKLVTARKVQFSRYNPEGDSLYIVKGAFNLDASFIKNIPEDSLDFHLKAMAPIVGSVRVEIMNNLLDKGNSKAKQFFIHRYWIEEAGKFAEQAFAGYMKAAHFVDGMFRSGFGYGFETDRGHIFLKYGKPDDIIEVEDEPSAPPYEIWIYNKFPATHQSNVRFLFYNPSLTKNGHKLLHSTALGEVKNDRWEIELYRDATLETPGVNEKEMGENVHRNARKYFENF